MTAPPPAASTAVRRLFALFIVYAVVLEVTVVGVFTYSAMPL